MLKAYCDGERDFFKGLASDCMDLDWTPSPVFRFDFNAEDFLEENGLQNLLNRLIGEYEKEYGMTEITNICGWTENELVSKFHSGIVDLSKEREEDFSETIVALRNYYDGYRFAPKGSRIYNPYSVLCALKSKEIRPYWFETGTPTFLAEWVKKKGMDPEELNGVTTSLENLVSIGFDHLNPVPLMFQTGYLSIESYDTSTQLYSLGFPNREVEVGFFQCLLPQYAPEQST